MIRFCKDGIINPSHAVPNATLPILYSFRRCPYAIRARLALAVAGITVEHREVSLKNKPPSMLAYSPKGTVPVLVLPSGQVIDQSIAIGQWALGQHDPQAWLSGQDPDLAAHWIERNDHIFKPLLDRYKYAERHPELSAQQHFELALEAFIAPLNEQIQSQGGHLCGPSRRWGDAAVFPFVRQFAAVDPLRFESARLHALNEWLVQWQNSDLFLQVMQRHPDWREPPQPAAQSL